MDDDAVMRKSVTSDKPRRVGRRRALVGAVVAIIALAALVNSLQISGAAASSRQPPRQHPQHLRTATTTTVARKSHPKKATAHEPMKDFAIQPATLTPAEYNSLLDLAVRAGAKVISLDVTWSSYEPNGPSPQGEWTSLDAFVKDVVGRRLELRFQLVGFPNWARDAGDPSSASAYWLAPSSAAELSRWSAFVSRVAGHFGTEVTYYEIWNEENISAFWSSGPDPTAYARLLEASYTAIKSQDPSAQVMFGGISRNDVGFVAKTYGAIDRLFPATAESDHHFFDILGVHPYSGNRSPEADGSHWVYSDQWGTMDENFMGIEMLHNLLVAEGEGWKHLYIGEYGFTTTTWEAFGPVRDSIRAQYLTDAFSLAAKTGYVDGLCWYYTYTTPWNPASWALLKGSYPKYQPTQTYKALAAIPN